MGNKKLRFEKKKVKDLTDEDYFVCNCIEGNQNVEYLHYYLGQKETWLHKHPVWIFRRGRTGEKFKITDGDTIIYSLKIDT